ncbi:MAG: ABC transporter permease [Anaerolineaceae bacterium]|nr:ABC transporter permease [Anaerolineaceae bacterium]
MLMLTLESDMIDVIDDKGIPQEKTPFQLALARFTKNKLAIAAFVLMIFIVLSAILASVITTTDPIARNVSDRLGAPSSQYWFGTDAMGRDVFTRILYGGRISLWIGLASVFVSLTVGVPLGLISGYFGGVLDMIIMRIMDLILSFPGIIFAIWLVAMMGPGINQVILAIAFWNLPEYSRVIRGSVLSLKDLDYIQAVRALGGNSIRIMFSHVLPNVLAPIIIISSLSISGAIIAGASLSFLGLGAQPPSPEWGLMLSDGRPYLRQAWWLMVFPGFAITLFVLASNIFGDGLRDALDPRSSTN